MNFQTGPVYNQGKESLKPKNFKEWEKKALSLKGGIFVLSGPSGVGKTSLVEIALKKKPRLAKTITYTTRSPRKSREAGNPYYFVSRSQFQSLKKQGAFLEWAEIYDELYGTAWEEVCRIWNKGQFIIKDVDIQGGRNIKRIFPQAVTVFVYPPSLYDLKARLIERGEVELKKRLFAAKEEMAAGAGYDFKIVNENLKKTWLELKKIIEKELAGGYTLS